VVKITGLSQSEVGAMLARAGRQRVPGKSPTRSDHVFLMNQARRLEVSYLLNVFGSMLESGNSPARALVAAYRRYARTFDGTAEGRGERGQLISFDRAFDFVSRTYCLWGHTEPQLVMVACRRCGSRYVNTSVVDARDTGECPCCCMAQRYRNSDRVRRYIERIEANANAAQQAVSAPAWQG
jgi:hypothetical protein